MDQDKSWFPEEWEILQKLRVVKLHGTQVSTWAELLSSLRDQDKSWFPEELQR
jgi:hypothetical protein